MIRYPAAIAFVGSFCLMVLELVAGRMMAPYLGVSLYTWTSIIGIILVGLSLGAFLGGRLADRAPTRHTLGGLFVLAGTTTLLGVYAVPFFGGLLEGSGLPLFLATLLFALAAFFPPSLFLGCISPVLVKMTLRTLDETGTIVGRISAAGAVGSIAGTFMTGYVFIAALGTRVIMLSVALALLALGVIIMNRIPFARRFPLYALLLIGGSFLLPSPCTVESAYYCIRIQKRPDGYVLRLDHLVHSYVHLPTGGDLGYEYENAFALLYAAQGKPAGRVAYIGGGGYALPRYVEKWYPASTQTVLEIDPRVTDANYERMELPRDTRIKTITGDARRFFSRLPAGAAYDAIFGDAFNDLSVPYHLTTREFAELVRNHLVPGGFYAVNIIDDSQTGRFLPSMIRTFMQVFPEVALVTRGDSWQTKRRNTFVLVGSRTPIPAGRFDSFTMVRGPELDAYAVRNRGLVLSDDYAPVENLLAHVFREAYR